MIYQMKCKDCQHEMELDISLRMYEEGKPHKCKCGGTLERDFRSTTAIRTFSSPSRA